MQVLLNLLAGVALLVWGTHIVRTGILRLWGGDLNFRCNLYCGCWGRLDLLAGARYLELDEQLNIVEALAAARQPTVDRWRRSAEAARERYEAKPPTIIVGPPSKAS